VTVTPFALARLSPSELIAVRQLLLDYVIAKERHVQLLPLESFVDVINQVETTPEQLLELFAGVEITAPPERPANSISSVELDALLERVQADAVAAAEFEGKVVAPAVGEAGLELAPPCHTGAPVRARYAKGLLTLRCVVCNAGLAHVIVGAP
jgi:hypothetical protein